jgi:hypothetical protein
MRKNGKEEGGQVASTHWSLNLEFLPELPALYIV